MYMCIVTVHETHAHTHTHTHTHMHVQYSMAHSVCPFSTCTVVHHMTVCVCSVTAVQHIHVNVHVHYHMCMCTVHDQIQCMHKYMNHGLPVSLPMFEGRG